MPPSLHTLHMPPIPPHATIPSHPPHATNPFTPSTCHQPLHMPPSLHTLHMPPSLHMPPIPSHPPHATNPFTPSTCHQSLHMPPNKHPPHATKACTSAPSTCHQTNMPPNQHATKPTCHQTNTLHMPPRRAPQHPPHATKPTCHQTNMPPNQHATKPTPSTCHQGVHLSTLLSSRPRHPEFRQRGPFTISSCHNTQPLIPCCQVPPSSEQVPPSSEQCNSSAPFFPAAHAIQIFNRGDLSQHPASHTLLPGATKLRAGATKLRAVNHFSTLLSSRPRYPELRQEDHQDAHASFKTPMLRSSRPCFVQAAHAIQSYDKKTIKPDKRTVTLNQKPPLTVLPCRPLPVGVGKGLT